VHKTGAILENADHLVLMAEVVGVHGIKGWVKLKIFSADPEGLADFAPFYDATGKRTFDLLAVHPHGNIFLGVFDGVNDRNAAEALRGVKLYLPRENLPDIDADDTFYHVDLIGLAAQWPDGRPMGKVVNVANFGAGDLLEIRPLRGASFYVPFTNEIVPDVNMAQKIVTVNPPPGLLD
jgi:16S rRNA processing protein RimM